MADYLSLYIFHAGSHGEDRTQRIAFKGGKYPGRETDLGGLCRTALRDRIVEALEKRPHFIPENAQPSGH
jgi:hypothetical protein